jgi:hypothetical protein
MKGRIVISNAKTLCAYLNNFLSLESKPQWIYSIIRNFSFLP